MHISGGLVCSQPNSLRQTVLFQGVKDCLGNINNPALYRMAHLFPASFRNDNIHVCKQAYYFKKWVYLSCVIDGCHNGYQGHHDYSHREYDVVVSEYP